MLENQENEIMQKLVLIDGNAILHRAFHALPPLTSKDGKMINAVYGFFSMLFKILEDQKPDYLIVCFDRPKPTFRKALYVGYQAKRPKMSDDLIPQIVTVHELLEKIKIDVFEVDGYEADDLIGTIATQAVEGKLDGGLDVIIVTGDRDMLQLVNSHVKVLAPIIGITKMILFDEAKVVEKYGLKPSQFVDYKALVGDQSDNYPGVTGIGPKTASEILKKLGTLENAYKNLGELAPKVVEKLSTDAEQAMLAKKLATIVTDAPITLDLERCAVSRFDIEGFKKALGVLGFKSLLKRIEGRASEDGSAGKEKVEKNSNQMKLL